MIVRSFFCYFILGIAIGFLLSNFLLLSKKKSNNEYNNKYNNKYNETVVAVKSRPLKILCVILTGHKLHGERAIHVRSTWGKHCDKLLFVSNSTDPNMDVIGFNVIDDHGHLWGKIKLVFKYIYENFIDDYDWIYKGDDDTFAIIENMRYMLSSHSPKEPTYFGHRFKTGEHKYGYFSGGSGYVMSNTAARLFVEKTLSNVSLCEIGKDTGAEDWNIGKCLELAGVHAADGRDVLKRERFLPFVPEGHLFPSHDPKFWYWSYNYYNASEGLDCCSNYTIATHYVPPKYMYTLYFLTYHLRIMGVKRKFPPIIEHFTAAKSN